MNESCMTEEKTVPAYIPLGGNGKRRTYILTTGIIKCANCDAEMEGKPQYRSIRAYACVPPSTYHPGKTGCGRVSIRAIETDHLVATKVLAYLTMPGRIEQLNELIAKNAATVEALAQEVTAVQALMRETAANVVKGRASGDWRRETERVAMIQVRALRRQARKAQVHLAAVDGLDSIDRIADWWENVACNEEKHDLIRLLVDEVRVSPTTLLGSKRFQPERIEIVWRPGIVWDTYTDVAM